MKLKKNILICPLNWGLGHATRCVPLINELISQNANVIITADGRPFDFLKDSFPHLEFINFRGYNIRYPKTGKMSLKLLTLLPKLFYRIVLEHFEVKRIINDYNIDLLISDNRFGLWNKNIPCIFITHQIMIKTPKYLHFFEGFLFRISNFIIKKYNKCWIPDFEGSENLSGDLSHKYPIPSNSEFIGPLSRFTLSGNKQEVIEYKYDVLAIISGPEPQRTILENILLSQLKSSDQKAIVVRGITDFMEHNELRKNCDIFTHLPTEKLKEYILQSKIIICRPGYSSIMDISALGKNAIFIPTPGQTEQEYLAEYLFKKKYFFFSKQIDFNLKDALEKSKDFRGLQLSNKPENIQKTIQKFLELRI
ncbi:MAG: hypothetical protein JEY97_09525 [Bacteroidales bacterium]|nr:hypothetical protein [Bacteroidales bacterium]